MKRLKLFPKTFLVSIGLFAALIILVHALVYTLMPQFYLQQKEREAADNLTALTTIYVVNPPRRWVKSAKNLLR
ncbi:hypothetical protein GWK73_03600 [Candidatus Saccharibacteria bacterium oral taxon 955]|nr:hypothetical protein GWK73_03600 [Candidatus Saccharibacteria bacterium oral taxon 955]